MRQIVIWLVTSALGFLLVVLLPENLLSGERLFSLSPGHGPSSSDAIGIAIMLAGWAWFVRATLIAWRSRESIGPGVALALLAGAGLTACLVAVSTDHNLAAIAFGAVAVAAQIALGIIPHCFVARETK